MKNVERYTKTLTDFNPSDFTILAVDDVNANVMLVKMVLSRAGFNVVTTTKPLEFVTLAKEHKPDLFILDVLMPALNGFQLAGKLKEDPELAAIPIIFLTAYEDTESMIEGFHAGASDYITKPFIPEVLQARVKSQLKLVASRNVIEQQNEHLKDVIYGRDKMYSVIAHDLRSPLGTVKMSLKGIEDMMRYSNADEMLTELIVESEKQVSELFNLLDNLLKWTKSQTGTLKVASQVFEVSTIVTGMFDMYKSIALQKNIILKVDESAQFTGLVKSDPDMCNTVLRNLLSNAIKFTDEGKEIKIRCTQEDGFAVVSVHDQGCGMTEEEQGKLFNKDTHFSKYGTAREEGSGLGLLLCKNFAEMIGGKLTLHSVLGEGSTFSLYIPLYNEMSTM